MTALTTLPFCTWPSGAASFTAAVIMSPKPAFNPVDPPSGRIICSLRAGELSATSSMLLIITAMASISRSLCHPEQDIFRLALSSGARRFLSREGSRTHRNPSTKGASAASLLRVRLQHSLRHQCGLAHNVFQLPALQLRRRTGLFDPHHIPNVGFVLLVVGVKL